MIALSLAMRHPDCATWRWTARIPSLDKGSQPWTRTEPKEPSFLCNLLRIWYCIMGGNRGNKMKMKPFPLRISKFISLENNQLCLLERNGQNFQN